MRVKQSFLNLAFGLVSQLLTIALGIFIPRLFLINFGSEVNGLLASVGQIMIYMSLFEAGVGAASVQALYKPITNGDKTSINSILSATSNYYRKTGIIYFITVILISLSYPFFIDSKLSNLTIMSIILLIGLGGALNHYFIGKIRVYLMAEGKSYIDLSITTLINLLNSVIKIVLLLKGFNIIVIQASYLLLTILQILLFQIYINKNYKWLNFRSVPNFNSIKQKSSVLVHQFSYLVFNNTDVLILTIFTNLKVVSVYVMYNMLFSMVENIIIIFNSSVTAALGQTFHESKEKFNKFFVVFETYFMALVYCLFTIAYILIIPFMKLYTEGIKDINYIDPFIPILFVSLKLLSTVRFPANKVIDIAGHFKKTQNRSILESGINLVCSLIFVQFFGIYGVLIGTILALLYRTIDMIVYANKYVLGRSPWKSVKRWIINSVLFIIVILIINSISINPASYISIIAWALMLLLVILPLYVTVNLYIDKEVYRNSKYILLKIYKQKIIWIP